MEQFNRHIKVSHRVVFPLELRLFNTVSNLKLLLLGYGNVIHIKVLISIVFLCTSQSDDAVNPDRMYDLVAVVIHCGSGPNRGHYISIVKSCGFWLIFDDDIVDVGCWSSVNFVLSLSTFTLSLFSENRGFGHRGFLRADHRHSEIVRNGIHSVLSIQRQQQLNIRWDVNLVHFKAKSSIFMLPSFHSSFLLFIHNINNHRFFQPICRIHKEYCAKYSKRNFISNLFILSLMMTLLM